MLKIIDEKEWKLSFGKYLYIPYLLGSTLCIFLLVCEKRVNESGSLTISQGIDGEI